jgi:paraquat-inducible protein B
MNEPHNPSGLDSLPKAIPHQPRRLRLSWVWLVPILAGILAGWIAVRAILDRGPAIEVTFKDAEGIEAGKTKVRYKSVDIGSVKTVTLTSDRRTVHVLIQMEKFARPFIVAGSRFWVVRPRLGVSGVSGLGTLLSGAYIAMDAGSSQAPQNRFAGLEVPPIVAGDTAGTEFVLDGQDLGSLGVGAPAYFRHIQVGQVSAVMLNRDGRGIILQLFVYAPYDHFVTDDTRFWHASGVDVAVSSSGVHLQTESLATVLAGGIAFEAPTESTAIKPATPGTHFRLARNRESAMKAPDRVVESYVLYFEESLRGLMPGASVDFRGIEIGEVASMNVEYDRAGEKFLFPVLIHIYPERIEARYRSGTDRPQTAAHALVATMIGHGYRAQLRSSSLLTGQLYIALDSFPRATPVIAQPELTPMPFPTIPGNIEQLQNTVVSLAQKLDRLPVDRIAGNIDSVLTSLHAALDGTNHLVGSVDKNLIPEAQSALAQARMTLADTQHVVAPEASLQGDVHSTLTSIGRAADSVRVLADYLDQHPEALLRGKAEGSK